MRVKILTKLDSPNQNLIGNEISFGNKHHVVNNNNKFPVINLEKHINKQDYLSPDKKITFSKFNNNSVSKNDIKKGIVWLKSQYFTIPKLIIPKNINLIKTPLSDNHLSRTKKYHKMKLDNSFRLTKDYFPMAYKFVKNKELSEILGLKKGRSQINILENQRKDMVIDKYIEKLGVLKYLDERFLKLVNVGKVENKTISKNSTENEQNKKSKKNKSILMRYMERKKDSSEQKIKNKNKNNKSYFNLLLKKKKIKKENIQKENSFDFLYNKRITYVKQQIEKCDVVYKEITGKLKNLYEKKRKEFEKIINNEFHSILNSKV